MLEFICGQCKKTFFRSVRRRFCSKECHSDSMRLPLKKCPQCCKNFVPGKNKQKFCSLKCFNASAGGARDQPEPSSVHGCRWIPLTQGKFTLVDEARYDELACRKWLAVKGPNGHWYAKRAEYRDGRQIGIYMHNQILNKPPGFLCDHRNGDGLDNRGENLRIATQAQNQMNSSRPGSTGFKGVSKTKDGKFVSKIHANGIYKYLGRFFTVEEAAKAYDVEARKLHRSYGRYNFPLPGERSAR